MVYYSKSDVKKINLFLTYLINRNTPIMKFRSITFSMIDKSTYILFFMINKHYKNNDKFGTNNIYLH